MSTAHGFSYKTLDARKYGLVVLFLSTCRYFLETDIGIAHRPVMLVATPLRRVFHTRSNADLHTGTQSAVDLERQNMFQKAWKFTAC